MKGPKMSELATIAANMRHAARNGESVTIGGGIFGPSELKAAADVLARAANRKPQKTAIIDQYHIFGSQSGHGCRLMYGGKVLSNVTGHSSQSADFLKAAIEHAARLGFTHWRRLDNVGGKRAILKG